MIRITEHNTTGKIGSFLKTYKELDMAYITEYKEYVEWFKDFKTNVDSDNSIIAFDIETKKLYPINNKMTWFALTWKKGGVYYSRAFEVNGWSNEQIVKVLNSLNVLKSKKVLHNAYFDITTLAICYGVKVKWHYDTYIMFHNAMTHRAKDTEDNDFGQENTGLSLKDLTRDYLPYGDYESELNDWKKAYCRENKLKAKEFTYDLFPTEIIAPYNCMDTTCTYQLFEVCMKLIKQLEVIGYTKLRDIIKMKHEVSDIYMDARARGIYIDRDKAMSLYEYYKQLRDKSYGDIMEDLKPYINKLERELYFQKLEKELMKDFEYIAENKPKVSVKTKKETWVSKQVKITDKRLEKIREESKINLNSSQHKGMLFCDIMGLEPLERTPTKAPKCDIKFMEYYADTNTELRSFLDYGKCRTAINNFLGVEKLEGEDEEEVGKGDAKTLWELTSEEYPYLHPSYNLNGTVTGRCSCSQQNLQQIPSRGILKDLKKAYSARDNHYLLYSDYSSAEISIMASIIDSKVIFDATQNEWDLHSVNVWSMMKDKVLAVHPDWDVKFEECGDDVDKLRDFYKDIKNEFDSTLRYKCKSLTFSLAYGTTAHGVAKNLNIPKKEAQELIDKYLDSNPEMKKYINSQHTKAKTYGYTENPFGSRLMLPDCPNMYITEDRHVKMRAEKQLKKSLNVPIQSSNAHLLYEGIVRAKKLLKEAGLSDKVHFMFSVYDSFCYEIHESVPKEVVIDIMERAFVCYLGNFYLGIDVEIGDSWGTLEGVKRDRVPRNKVHNYMMKMY